MKERVRIWDILLISALTAACFLFWFFPKNQGETVIISVNGEQRAALSLREDTCFSLEDGTQILVENGAVRVSFSTCPDHLCEHMGPVSSRGEVILCVPNRISVEIAGKGVDAVVG